VNEMDSLPRRQPSVSDDINMSNAEFLNPGNPCAYHSDVSCSSPGRRRKEGDADREKARWSRAWTIYPALVRLTGQRQPSS
jgi:hypothetical protein